MAIQDGEELVKVTLVDDGAPTPTFEDPTFPGRTTPSSGGTYQPTAEGETGFMKETDAAAAVASGSVLINVDNTPQQIEAAIAASAMAAPMSQAAPPLSDAPSAPEGVLL